MIDIIKCALKVTMKYNFVRKNLMLTFQQDKFRVYIQEAVEILTSVLLLNSTYIISPFFF